MNLDAPTDGDKAKDLVAIDGLATASQLVVDTLQVLVYHQDIILNNISWQTALVQYEVGCTFRNIVTCDGLVALLQFYIFVYDMVDI